MLGVELVSDRMTKTPAKAETLQLFETIKGPYFLVKIFTELAFFVWSALTCHCDKFFVRTFARVILLV